MEGFQTIKEILLSVICWLTCLVSLYFFVAYGLKFKMIKLIEEIGPPNSYKNLVSVIIPACNEGKMLYKTVYSILKQEHENLQIILINDRSTDDTGNIISELAGKDGRIEVINIKELPAGWLGKPHALHIAMKKVKGEYVLVSDADVIFGPKVIKRAIQVSQLENADLITIKARIIWTNFSQQIVLGTLIILLVAKWVSNRGLSIIERIPKGIGNFNFIKTSSFNKTEGFVALKMEILDDIGVGHLLQKEGFRCLLFLTHSELSQSWYRSVSAAFKGLEKNLFSITAKFSYPRMLVISLLTILNIIGPWICLLFPFGHYLYLVSGIVLISLIVFSIVIGKHLSLSAWSILFLPLGTLFFIVALINSSVAFYFRNGITWRGTHYSAEELKKGRIV